MGESQIYHMISFDLSQKVCQQPGARRAYTGWEKAKRKEAARADIWDQLVSKWGAHLTTSINLLTGSTLFHHLGIPTR